MTPPILAASVRVDPVVNRRQRQKSTRLAPVLGLLGLAAKLSCVKIVSKSDRHRELHGSQHRIKSFPILDLSEISTPAGVLLGRASTSFRLALRPVASRTGDIGVQAPLSDRKTRACHEVLVIGEIDFGQAHHREDLA